MIARIDAAIARAEAVLLTVVLVGLIVLASLQALLRAIAQQFAFSWADGVMSCAPIWIAFLGASLATQDGRHLSVDVLSRLFAGRARHIVVAVTSLFAGLVAAAMAVGHWNYIGGPMRIEPLQSGQLPWFAYEVTPVLLAIIALRFFLRAGRAAAGAWKNAPLAPDEAPPPV